MNRFVVIVLDSFGIGAMDDVKDVRPQDIGSNTALHLIQSKYPKNWSHLCSLGLMNSMGQEFEDFRFSQNAIYGSSKLKHYGADSFFGHQEIAGTDPKKPVFSVISKHLDELETALTEEDYQVERIHKNNLTVLCVNQMILIGDNMETDLGQAINVVGALDDSGFEMIRHVGHIVREHVQVARVIAFGGSGVHLDDLKRALITKGEFIGVDAPGSGVYRDNYHVEHIGYGVDTSLQVPIQLAQKGIHNAFYGKVANIVHNPLGTNFDAVDTDTIFSHLCDDLAEKREGFYFINIQETDLAGHAEDCERYVDRINVSDQWIGKVIRLLDGNDILIVMADHGNDPTIGHPQHTRERVPLLIWKENIKGLHSIGVRETMADVGQTVADYFQLKIAFGTSFLDDILKA